MKLNGLPNPNNQKPTSRYNIIYMSERGISSQSMEYLYEKLKSKWDFIEDQE
jgi:hypothetical protein